jgi:hypothetical protein
VIISELIAKLETHKNDFGDLKVCQFGGGDFLELMPETNIGILKPAHYNGVKVTPDLTTGELVLVIF